MVYRAGIVGLTGIAAGGRDEAPVAILGKQHPGSHASSYAQIPNTTVVGVCDLVPALGDKFKEDWGAVWPDVRFYTDYRQMLAEGNLDILSVVTSDHRHAQIVVDAAAAGVKAIYCEKPIATTLADADRMIAACEAHNVVMSIDHTRRWRPVWHQARNLIRSGEIGPLKRIVATLAGPRAMLFRNGTHLLDAVCFFADSGIDWLMAELDDEHHGHAPRYTGDGGRRPELDPGGSAYIHYSNGVRAFINASKSGMGGFGLELHCERGCLTVDDRTGAVGVWTPGAAGRTDHWLIPAAQTTVGNLRGGIEELITHLEARQRGETPEPLVSPPQAGRQVLEILLGIFQSNHAGNAKISFPVQDV